MSNRGAMTAEDVGTFERAFRRLSGAYQLRVKPGEWEELTRTYFRLLDGYPLDAVLRAALVCMQTLKHFPKPVEWLEVLDRPVPRQAPAPIRAMTDDELDTLTEAEAFHYERQPCACAACVDAGVTDQPLRFVPTLEGGTEARAMHPTRGRAEVLGHWAHGDELRRWYVAREAFFRRAQVAPHARPVLALVGREPGEEG